MQFLDSDHEIEPSVDVAAVHSPSPTISMSQAVPKSWFDNLTSVTGQKKN